jgi:hypothetical protein
MSSIFNPLLSYALKAGVYAFGPFFCYPWKPAFNAIWGESYSLGYKHFYDQHKHPSNLGMHLVCLFFQLFGNFSFLSSIDQLFFPGQQKYLSQISALFWSLSLLVPKECPLLIKISSLASIALAYFYSSSFTGPQIEIAGFAGVFFVFLIHLVTYWKSLKIDKQGITISIALAVKWGLYYGLQKFGILYIKFLIYIYIFIPIFNIYIENSLTIMMSFIFLLFYLLLAL